MTESVTETERALLAAALRSPEQYERLRDIVGPADFSWQCYGWAWDAMDKLNDKGLTIDVVTLGDELDRDGKLDQWCLDGQKLFYGRAALSKIKEIPTKRESAESYALIVNDYAVKRKIMQWASDMVNWAQNGRTASAIISDIEACFASVNLHSGKTILHTHNAQTTVAKSVHATEEAANGIKPIQSGLIDVDNILGGFHRTDLVVVAARPGAGKTAFLLTAMLNALRSKKKCLLFSIEMGVEQVGHRFISQICDVPVSRIRDGKIQNEEWSSYFPACEEVSGFDFIVNDMPSISIAAIRTEARKVQPDIVFVDYIQLAEASIRRDQRRDQEIGAVTRGLKALAKELDIPVVAAAQCNRASEMRSKSEPYLSDLRESGDIENDSDVVLFLWREDDTNEFSVSFKVGKHRNGPQGRGTLYYRGPQTRFENASTIHMNGYKDHTV